jgi:hypothetical protein
MFEIWLKYDSNNVRFMAVIVPSSGFYYHLTASAGFLLGLFLNPENGGDMCLRNIGLSPKLHGVTHPGECTRQ